MAQIYSPSFEESTRQMPFAYLRSDQHAKVVYSNGYLERTYGIGYDKLEGSGWQELVHPDDKRRLLILFAKDYFLDTTTVIGVRLLFSENVEIPMLVIAQSLNDDANNAMGFTVYVIDISEGLRDITRQAAPGVDFLTQLPCRMALLSKLEDLHLARKKHHANTALVLIDLHGLGKLNELWGYTMGDQLLIRMGENLRASFGTNYFLGRYEGDKFAMIIENYESREALDEIVRKIWEISTQSITLPQGNFLLDVCLGVALADPINGEVDLFMRHAKEALRIAKNSHERMGYYNEQIHRSYRRTTRIVSLLFDAISQNQFELYFQPQVEAKSESLYGIEVLLRWNNPELGIVEPDEFIPIAEESGFIIHLGKWVINHALAQFKEWMDNFPHQLGEIKLSINLSPLQLLDDDLLSDLKASLTKYKVPPERLVLELTENAIMRNPEKSIVVLNQLKDLGVSLSMDDFGTGYSSLNYMRFLPINQIKIDRSFINAVEHSKRDAAVVRATIALADSLEMKVIAEGVENASELRMLRECGCDFIQGYYFSHPLNAEGMEEYMKLNYT